MRKKFATLFSLLTIFAVIAAGCGNANGSQKSGSSNSSSAKQESITAVGSTALQPLVQEAATQYMNNNAGATINVQGGGSGTGLSKVVEGAVQIGNSDVFAEEKDGIDASKIVDHKVAVVGFAPVVNKGVGVKNITKQQLIGIFTGKITNWKEVGGKDQKIVIINRAEGSGTRTEFEKWALDGATTVKAQEQDSSGTVQKIVSETPGAISYLAFSYINDKVQALKVDGVEPTEDNVKTNKWKIWAYEHMYTNGEPKGLTKKFIDYMLSDEVQKNLVPKLGYMSISDMKVERDAKGNVTNK
ncbi:phosphate ABC transporter substrate-binding protein [Weizmannia acidilactici]|uniref:Phosphate-binding protein n=1 Tax=Weizmannia acidilactici TaxID=2607726 RepID=A0A5J4JE58_9BACI|nr:phosphate ABC transporter substrate-binding protein [Weizmannia acidilactici]GER65969.1 phosphate ABC transporter substrate-binding protein [Weizmannia acidilactici]GER68817.1 phosphate ABC transporter substrate-binding protein [Weizmannia acidilactici]GER72898.1 phosphate ABC transporter substrate-binding protein [Weizmannia acidilactici]